MLDLQIRILRQTLQDLDLGTFLLPDYRQPGRNSAYHTDLKVSIEERYVITVLCHSLPTLGTYLWWRFTVRRIY